MSLFGALVYSIVFWKKSGSMNTSKRLVFMEFGFTVVVYSLLFYTLVLINNLNINVIVESIVVAGFAFLFVDIGRSFVVGKIVEVISTDSKAYSLGVVYLSIFEVNAILVVMIFVLGVDKMIRMGMPYYIFNTSMIYVSMGAVGSAIIMGIIMNRAWKSVETRQDMQSLLRNVAIQAIFAHLIVIIGTILAVYAMLPYIGE